MFEETSDRDIRDLNSRQIQLGSDFSSLIQNLQRHLISPVDHLLSADNREEPSLHEKAAIQGLLAKQDGTFDSEINSVIEDLHRFVGGIQQERAAFDAVRHQHINLIAPINLLPPEILEEIFVLIPRLRKKDNVLPPVVAQINRHWRHIALSSPRIWSFIYVQQGRYQSSILSTTLQRVELWLKRSQRHPLTLTIRIDWEGTSDQRLSSLLIPEVYRWKTLIVENLIPLPLFRSLETTDSRPLFPILRSCQLGSALFMGYIHDRDSPWTFLQHAPNLQCLKLAAPASHVHYKAPLTQLTLWDCDVITPSAFQAAMEQLTQLYAAYFKIWDVIGSTLKAGIPPHHLVILHLEYVLRTTAENDPRLDTLPHFPFLQEFFLRICDTHGYHKSIRQQSIATPIVPFFIKSGSNIERLWLSIGVAPESFEECLRHTPKLTFLHVNSSATADAMSYLIVADNSPLVPKLHTLHLSGRIPSTPEVLYELVDSRLNCLEGSGCAKLRMLMVMPQEFMKWENHMEIFIPFFGDLQIVLRGLDLPKFLNHEYPDADGVIFSRRATWTEQYLYDHRRLQ